MRDGVFTQNGAHNHDAQFEEQHRAAAVNECLDLARAPGMGRQGPKRIVEIARSVHREARIALNPALERRIQREKRSNQPLPPTSIDDMMESMAYHPVFKETIRGDLFFHGTVRSDEDDDVPGLPAEDEAAEDELNEEEAPEDRQGDVSNEDIADVPFGHGRQRFRAGVRLTERQRRAMERRNRAAARHNRREIFENLPPRNETPPPVSPTPDSPPARLDSPERSPIRPQTPDTHFRSMASPAGLMSADTSPRQVRQRHRKKYLRIRPLRSIQHDPEKILEQRLLALRANRVREHDEPRVLIREEIVDHQRRAVARNPSPPNI
ncbi:hypothetical protein OUZ56_025114 [Daphnia magna]|uniref:Uncharacterized protein n=2 Tax=Daphnia magna TaxID=35525 RepID=A0ABQ9ZJI9_9CRUS|nr:hypothetical protein OUZ56_025114 [Daphnia magna]